MTLCAGLSAYIRAFAEHRAADGGATHPEEEWQELRREVGQLLWMLEEAIAPAGADVIHSEDAVGPDGHVTEQPLMSGAETPARGSDGTHSFSVWRLLPDGRWTGAWSEATKATVAFRGQCSCGWEGPEMQGDADTGYEDDYDRERVYDYWDRNHCPDWEARHGLS